jgi:hypothetical protein
VVLQNYTDLLEVVSSSSSETSFQWSHDGSEFVSTKIEAGDEQEEEEEPVSETFTGTEVEQEVSSMSVCPSLGSFHIHPYLPLVLTP